MVLYKTGWFLLFGWPTTQVLFSHFSYTPLTQYKSLYQNSLCMVSTINYYKSSITIMKYSVHGISTINLHFELRGRLQIGIQGMHLRHVTAR